MPKIKPAMAWGVSHAEFGLLSYADSSETEAKIKALRFGGEAVEVEIHRRISVVQPKRKIKRGKK